MVKSGTIRLSIGSYPCPADCRLVLLSLCRGQSLTLFVCFRYQNFSLPTKLVHIFRIRYLWPSRSSSLFLQLAHFVKPHSCFQGQWLCPSWHSGGHFQYQRSAVRIRSSQRIFTVNCWKEKCYAEQFKKKFVSIKIVYVINIQKCSCHKQILAWH